MKKLVATILAVALFTFSLGSPALADGDIAAGEAIFNGTGTCYACHSGGGNILNPAATLSQADLEANGRYSVEDIIYQVTYGAGLMSAFGGQLTEQEIADVAAYVYDQASNNKWP